MNYNNILKNYGISSNLKPFGNGHINDTFITDDGRYIVQSINTAVFTEPAKLMENIEKVTDHVRKCIAKNGGDVEKECLEIIKTLDGRNYCNFGGKVYRLYRYISGSKTVENDRTYKDLYEAGVGFGHFQKMLRDFPANELFEIIKDFHDTPKRVETLKKAINENIASRRDFVAKEIEFALEKSKFSSVVTDGIKNGEIPLRVTHNDTKINNILFDIETGKACCVIDLDTVMPGSVLYDFGDAMRIGASSAAEDETDLDKVCFDIEAFKYFTEGYLSEAISFLNDREIELLTFSAKLLTFECGIRFLTDYLNGDTYFKIHRENHNLDRARNQFKLLEDIEKKEDILSRIVEEAVKKYK